MYTDKILGNPCQSVSLSVLNPCSKAMHVIIRDFEHVMFDGFLKEIILPGEDGEISLWDFHQTIITRIKKGMIFLGSIHNPKTRVIKINSGIVKFHLNELIVLCS